MRNLSSPPSRRSCADQKKVVGRTAGSRGAVQIAPTLTASLVTRHDRCDHSVPRDKSHTGYGIVQLRYRPPRHIACGMLHAVSRLLMSFFLLTCSPHPTLHSHSRVAPDSITLHSFVLWEDRRVHKPSILSSVNLSVSENHQHPLPTNCRQAIARLSRIPTSSCLQDRA